MRRLLRRSLEEGAIGFSSSRAGHTDQDGLPVPSRAASREELVALCSVVSEFKGMTVGFSPDELFDAEFSDEMHALLVDMATAANQPMIVNGGGKLEAVDRAAKAGAVVRAMHLTHPNVMRMNLADGIVWDSAPGWNRTMHLPIPDKKRALGDAGVRQALRNGAAQVSRFSWTHFADLIVFDVQNPALQTLVGRRVGDIAAERGDDPFDTLLDIAIADDLETGFRAPGRDELVPTFWEDAARAIRDPRHVMGGSDAGAHLNMVASYDTATHLIAETVRKRELLTIEEVIKATTDAPARLFGIRDRGRLLPGWYADIAVFDLDTFAPQPFSVRRDLPGGSWRLTSEADGLHYVFVNGKQTYVDNAFTGNCSGVVLRGGRDTENNRGSL
jgi:N-acyl-D-aspartate/D-glutamate deacylase